MSDFAVSRQRMVDNQLRTNDVTDHRILDAMAAVPREVYVPKDRRAVAFIDEDLLLREADETGPARYLMKPHVFARLVQLAEVRPTDIVLVVGCASAYATAVLARLANSVVGVEGDPALAEAAGATLVSQGIDNAAIVAGDPTEGLASEGLYDVILIDGAVDRLPEKLFAQLKEGGRLVCIRGRGRAAEAMLWTCTGGEVSGRPAFNAAAHVLPGFEAVPEFAF